MDFIKNQLDGYGMSEPTIGYLSNMIMVVFIAVVSILANFLTKKIVLKIIIHIVNNNRYTWDNIIVEKKVFHKLSHLVPAIIIYFSASIYPPYQILIEKAARTYRIIVTITVRNALRNAFEDISRSFEGSKL
ncbi:mechanosensitive ion channel family protein, partial [Clostridium perfringens]